MSLKIAAYSEQKIIQSGITPNSSVSPALNLTLAKNSAAGHDAKSSDGKKIQIKGRRITASNRSRQLGVIRNLDKNDFDELIAVFSMKHMNPSRHT
ncbi:hypothetical protein [Stutzerimonas stutzeri]|uniref:hypothetical protein n=1 Tax=Stutzerimonas stutzeri TaxID=316 RepID=UPI001C612904|nr:hypothetical protein [Stutzerimonas stutzeri]